jgi:hypothetical protein
VDGWKLLLSTVISRIYCGSCIGVLGAVKPLDMGSVWCFGLGSLMSVALHLVRGSWGVFAGWNVCFWSCEVVRALSK